jgi:2-C-methyl-D-erythritol 4-phosphate cytidylyltransferase
MRVLLTSPLDGELLLGRTLREHVTDLTVPEGAGVVLDAAVPLVPDWFVADLVERTRASGRPHAGVRPVTDTVKVMREGLVGETLDRSELWQLAAPVVLPAPIEVPPTMLELVGSLAGVVFIEAPPLARRVSDLSDLRLLEALAEGSQPGLRPPGT